MTTTKMHELIDREYPTCLYCGNQCEIEYSSEKAPLGCTMDIETLTCVRCKEIFEIHSIQSHEGVTEYYAFAFTCQELCVYYRYHNEVFRVGDHGLLSGSNKGKESYTQLPVFDIDFSNNCKLYNKLKTYLIFS